MENIERNYDDLISDYRASGLSLRKWCDQNRVTESAMKYHMYKKKTREDDDCQFLELLPITIDEPEPKVSHITVTVGGADIMVTGDSDLALMKRIVEVLRND